jgi:hypothetical protein
MPGGRKRRLRHQTEKRSWEGDVMLLSGHSYTIKWRSKTHPETDGGATGKLFRVGYLIPDFQIPITT